jgi:HPt (histidine-containing phosphotransfer) domain-containing protein
VNPPSGQPGTAPPNPTSPNDIEVLDLGVLEEMGIIPGAGAGSIPSDIITIFLREERPRMEKIVGLAVERKVPELAQSAHNVAGSSAILGARQVQVAAIALELAVRAEDWPAVGAHLTELLGAWSRLEAALGRYRGGA